MSILLLLVIYLIFISLGLPDSVLGSSFQAISQNLNINVDQAGYIGLVVTIGTIISSSFSDKLISKIGAKWVVSLSILLTVCGLISFSFVKENYTWCFYLCAIPLGLGAGAIDSALNNYVAIHYKAIHMNWLHCSWGIGASVSPFIISSFIDSENNSIGWNKGVRIIAYIQLCIALISFIAMPLWSKANTENKLKKEERVVNLNNKVSYKDLFKNPVFYLTIFGFFSYCALETTTGFWSGNYFYYTWNLTTSEAARYTSLFYLGITAGRFISGPLSLKINEKWMIRIGETLLLIGSILLLLPFSKYCAIVGMALCGIGCAPIYPAIIKLTPYRFSEELSQKAMGLQMGLAYCGNLIVSPLFGLICRKNSNSFNTLPYITLFFALLMLLLHEISNHLLNIRDKKQQAKNIDN